MFEKIFYIYTYFSTKLATFLLVYSRTFVPKKTPQTLWSCGPWRHPVTASTNSAQLEAEVSPFLTAEASWNGRFCWLIWGGWWHIIHPPKTKTNGWFHLKIPIPQKGKGETSTQTTNFGGLHVGCIPFLGFPTSTGMTFRLWGEVAGVLNFERMLHVSVVSKLGDL